MFMLGQKPLNAQNDPRRIEAGRGSFRGGSAAAVAVSRTR